MQLLRVDWPVYPRRAEHNTVAEGGNRRWAETPSAESPALRPAPGQKPAATDRPGSPDPEGGKSRLSRRGAAQRRAVNALGTGPTLHGVVRC